MTNLARSVNAARPSIRARIDVIRGRIEQATRRSGRAADAVVLVGAVKQVDAGRIREAVEAGLADLGENRVQEAEAAIAAVGRSRVRWHMIGHLQRNKAGRAVELFDRIHGVDAVPLAEALSRRAAAVGRTVPVLVEVNVSGESSKFGVAPDALEALLERVAALPGLTLDGLMTIGAPADRAEEARGGIWRDVIDLLARLDGIDFRQTAPVRKGTPFIYPYGDEWLASERVLTQPVPGIKPTMIARAGGLDQGNIILNLADAERRGLSESILFLAGSAINSITARLARPSSAGSRTVTCNARDPLGPSRHPVAPRVRAPGRTRIAIRVTPCGRRDRSACPPGTSAAARSRAWR